MTAISRILAGGLAALGLLALAACGGGESTLKPAALLDHGGDELAAASLTDSAAGFTLTVSPDSFLGDESAGSFSLAVSSAGDELVATIAVTAAQSLRALYCELAYDATRYTPLSVDHLPLGASPDDADMLTISALDRPGVAHIGQVLAHWQDRTGLSGDASLATVRYARRPFTEQPQRLAAGINSPGAACPLLIGADGTVKVEYHFPGDYNQDGLVGVSDLTPLGMHFEERGIEVEPGVFRFPPNSIGAVVDGSSDGMITVSDITPIGVNFEARIESFECFHADSTAGYPDGGQTDKSWDFSYMRGEAGRQRRWLEGQLTLLIARANPGRVYWVRPVADGELGTPSNYAYCDESLSSDFTLEVEHETYYFGGSGDFTIERWSHGEDVVIDLIIDDAEDLACLSANVRFDPASFDLDMEDQPPREFGVLYPEQTTHAGGVTERPGCAHVTDLGAGYDVRPGDPLPPPGAFNGDMTMYRLTFRRGEQLNAQLGGPPHYASYSGWPVFDFYHRQLRWEVTFAGDLDQDSWVGVEDLLTLNYYTHTYGMGAEQPFAVDAMYAADANKDGFLNLIDLSLIGQRYDSHIEGYQIWQSWGSFDPEYQIGYVPYTDAIGNPAIDLLRFTYHVAEPVLGEFLWVVPVGSDGYNWDFTGATAVQMLVE